MDARFDTLFLVAALALIHSAAAPRRILFKIRELQMRKQFGKQTLHGQRFSKRTA